jgi:hypothetical protein
MTPKSEKEIEAVLRLDGPARFSHFVKQVVDFEEAWGLWKDGWALMTNNDGTSVFPLWPAREYAQLNCTGDWSEYEPRAIPLVELLDGLLPDLVTQGILPGVFPTPTGKGVTPSVAELDRTLREKESENYG